jgi:hypothetical protein
MRKPSSFEHKPGDVIHPARRCRRWQVFAFVRCPTCGHDGRPWTQSIYFSWRCGACLTTASFKARV